MEPKYRFRLFLLTALVLVGCGTLLSRLHEFQIEKRSSFVANIPSTHTVSVREPGVRGEITDRNGLVLARNRRSYEVDFNLEDIYKNWREQNPDALKNQGEETVARGDGLLTKRKKIDIVQIVNEWVIPRIESFGLGGERFSKALDVHFKTHGGLVPFTYRTDLTPDEFAQFAERSLNLPGVSVAVRPRRVYPYGTLACHVLGRVNKWDQVIPDDFRRRNMHYRGDEFGIGGIESTMNDHLQGEGGMKIFIRNEKNKVIALDNYTRPTEGARVELTIDTHIQYLVENIMRKVGRGAAVVMDPNTGEILAMVSVPNFDPNEFVPSIENELWVEYVHDERTPMLNRAISNYIPGSTYKLPTAIAAARHGRVGYDHHCKGYTLFGALKIKCWKKGAGHGPLGMSDAIQRSCNPYFMTLAGSLRSKAMVESFQLVGLGRRSGIRLPNEDPGMVVGSKAWKREYPGAVMTSADLAQLSIGQSQSGASPLQICSVAATIANGGCYYQPRIVRRVFETEPDAQGEEIVHIDNLPIVKTNLLNEGITKHRMESIRKGMWKAVNEPGGTARRVAHGLNNIFIAAKTGTAQLGRPEGHPRHDSHNAWTTSFAPYDNPRYAVCVMVQNGGSGGAVAGVLTNYIYRGLFHLETGGSRRLTKMGKYKGHREYIKELELPEGEDLLVLTIDEQGETGNEVDAELLKTDKPIKVTPNTIPLPSIAPEADSEAPPRAQLVEDDE
ncbi:MAG: peptidoglycan D,D-transpeptidase FtsI family protein [Akkermansiaceae bacterium]